MLSGRSVLVVEALEAAILSGCPEGQVKQLSSSRSRCISIVQGQYTVNARYTTFVVKTEGTRIKRVKEGQHWT
jgi:hypothetical protein